VAISWKRWKIRPRLLLITIGSGIRSFRWHKNHRPWMTFKVSDNKYGKPQSSNSWAFYISTATAALNVATLTTVHNDAVRSGDQQYQMQQTGRRDQRHSKCLTGLWGLLSQLSVVSDKQTNLWTCTWSRSCRATRCSNNFDSMVKLEIGQNDLTSAGSRSGFFSRGVM